MTVEKELHNADTVADAREFAAALVLLYEDGGFDGIADEMSYWQIDVSNKVWHTVEAARRFLAEHSNGNVCANREKMLTMTS